MAGEIVTLEPVDDDGQSMVVVDTDEAPRLTSISRPIGPGAAPPDVAPRQNIFEIDPDTRTGAPKLAVMLTSAVMRNRSPIVRLLPRRPAVMTCVSVDSPEIGVMIMVSPPWPESSPAP